ncbi:MULTISPECIES: hypothetical protein [unclassified Knoellia]|uniref:hypothetical protein n=1 Tax=Knoellia altitudinis TaxID=3404795 RepID=UPI00361341C7
MAGEDVEYPTEYMNTLANTKQTKWENDSTDGIKYLRDALADESSFGDVPALASYGRVFTEVRTIYLETMRGAKSDLDAVAQGIKTSAQQMANNDDAAGAAFLALWQRWENGPLDTTRHHEQAASTTGAQQAAADADAAEAAPEGAAPPEPAATDDAGANPDTRDEGAVPVEAAPGDSTGQPDAPLP